MKRILNLLLLSVILSLLIGCTTGKNDMDNNQDELTSNVKAEGYIKQFLKSDNQITGLYIATSENSNITEDTDNIADNVLNDYTTDNDTVRDNDNNIVNDNNGDDNNMNMTIGDNTNDNNSDVNMKTYSSAYVNVTDETRIYDRSSNLITINDLKEGMYVEASLENNIKEDQIPINANALVINVVK